MQESESNQRKSRALYALLELSKALSSEVDLDDLLGVIVEKASSVVESERTSIFIYDPSQERLWSRVAQGLGTATIELPVGSGVAGDVAKHMRLSNIADAYQDPRFNPESDRRTGFHTRSILSAPILASTGHLLGVIQSVNKTTAERFDSEDEALMAALASHVAVAIERARLVEVYLENERFEESLKVAHEIQMKMLPSGTLTLPEDSPFDLHAYIRPAKQVGGDLYDFFSNDRRLYFCIADVAGKGVGSALVMALTKTLMRANALFLDDPAEVLTAVNARLCEETAATMFVTAFCGFLDLRTGQVLYSNAGHDRPLVLKPGQAPLPLESRPELVLGVLPQFRYSLQRTQLRKGESLFLYTDGVTDADNPEEQLFSLDRLRKTLEQSTTDGPTGMIELIVESVDRFAGAHAQADDMTMLCIQFRGQATHRETEDGTAPAGSAMSRMFPREITALVQIFQMVEDFLTREQLAGKLRFLIDFVLEELFTNMVKYNASGASDIRIGLQVRGGELILTLSDFDAPRFDITDDAAPVDTGLPLENRIPGGLGIHLVKKMMDRVEYSHVDRVATITLYKDIQ